MEQVQCGFWRFAARNPDAPGVVDAASGKEWTRGDLYAHSNRLVHAARQQGLQNGDAIAVLTPNCTEMLALHLACIQAGWYLVPINWHLAGTEIAYILQDSEARLFVTHKDLVDSAAQAIQEAGFAADRSFSLGGGGGFQDYAQLLENQPDTLPAERTAGAVMNYTSGTTGRPKGVKRNLSGLDPDDIGALYASFLQLFGIQPEDDNVHLVGSPLYHTAVMIWAANSLHLGHAVVLMDKWDAEETLALIEKHRVSTSHMVPTQFRRLLLLPEEVRARYDLSSTRHMVHAAAPCPVHVKQAMLDWWGDSIYEYYGATEGGGTIVTPAEWKQRPGTVGHPWPGAEIKILDDAGEELPAKEEGTVYMRLADSEFEYKGDPQKTRANRRGDFFTVGDMGYLDEEGFLFLCDRKTDMIISGGANIYPAEIESVLLMHPQVADAAVFGIPNEDWGEEIKAVVEPASDSTSGEKLSQEILKFCSTRLAKFKLPKSIDYMQELPRDPNGKLYKRRLRDPYWQGRGKNI